MDALWYWIVEMVGRIESGLNFLFAPLNALGPTAAVFCIAALTVAVCKFFSRFKTRRYKRLKEEFHYWFDLKQEALKLRDEEPEKAERMAREIDRSTLNKVYYDFFIEGFLLNLATVYLPVLCMAAYVNEAYRPERLRELFGRAYLFEAPWPGSGPVQVGSVFWFVFSLLLVYAFWKLAARLLRIGRSEARAGAA